MFALRATVSHGVLQPKKATWRIRVIRAVLGRADGYIEKEEGAATLAVRCPRNLAIKVSLKLLFLCHYAFLVYNLPYSIKYLRSL